MRRAILIAAAGAVCISGCTATQAGRPVASGSPTAPASASQSVSPSVSPSVSQSSPTPSTATSRSATTAVRAGSATIPSITFPPGSGPVIVLNPGHDGGNATHTAEINRQVPAGFGEYKACDTTGTTTNAGYPEHAFNWDVTLRVRSILQTHGVRVVLTRSSDTGVGPCVDERAAIGNLSGVSAVISIHSDGEPASDHGFHVCYASRPPAGAAIEAESVQLSHAIHDALLRGSGLVPAAYIGDGHGYFARFDLAGLNLAKGPATFLEIGNMRNSSDASLLTSASGRARIAVAVASGILTYLGR